MNRNINYLSTGRLREVLAYERFQIKWFDFETFTFLENWSLRRGGRNRRFNRINNLTHRKFVVLINLSFLYSPGKLEVVHIVDFVESTKKRHTKLLYNEFHKQQTNKQTNKHQEVTSYLVICSKIFFLWNFRFSTGTGSTLLIWRSS